MGAAADVEHLEVAAVPQHLERGCRHAGAEAADGDVRESVVLRSADPEELGERGVGHPLRLRPCKDEPARRYHAPLRRRAEGAAEDGRCESLRQR